MNKTETEDKANYGNEAHGWLVDNGFLLSGNPDKGDDLAHHVPHHISRTWYGSWYLIDVQ